MNRIEEMPTTAYPLSLSIDYPGGDRNRLTTFFRLFMLIPILVILVLLSPDDMAAGGSGWESCYAYGGFVFLPLVLMILFRRKYPRWWFDWNLAMVKVQHKSQRLLCIIEG